ncbi:MAG TPA: hypothetical protein PLY87_01250 [Planctomycetaceae bacterium]|nr:hypothetical protein [Planctomycetaceae bacterium]
MSNSGPAVDSGCGSDSSVTSDSGSSSSFPSGNDTGSGSNPGTSCDTEAANDSCSVQADENSAANDPVFNNILPPFLQPNYSEPLSPQSILVDAAHAVLDPYKDDAISVLQQTDPGWLAGLGVVAVGTGIVLVDQGVISEIPITLPNQNYLLADDILIKYDTSLVWKLGDTPFNTADDLLIVNPELTIQVNFVNADTFLWPIFQNNYTLNIAPSIQIPFNDPTHPNIVVVPTLLID